MTPAPVPRRGRSASLVLLAWIVFFWLLAAVAWFVLPDYNASGQCEGIGWGCTLTPRDTLTFAAAFAGIPLTAGTTFIGLVFVGSAAARRWWPSLEGPGLGTLGLVIGVATSITVAAVLLGLGGFF